MRQTVRAAQAAVNIDLVVESELWKQSDDAGSLVTRAVTEAASLLSTAGAELAIVLSDDSAVRLLNRAWRGVDKATNVLSFPTKQNRGDPPLIGDVVLAYETIAREASAQHKPLADHVAHLAVHGFLHLLGYDHERNEDAEAMERVERDILRRLAIRNPYRRSAKS
jgi:probable rRNA maturation factor